MARTKTKKEESVEPGSDVVMDEAPTSHQPEGRDDMSVDEDENDEAEVEDNDADVEEDIQRVRLVCRISVPPSSGLYADIVS
jgi:DNA-directed RNA polymerase I and III subunit RPAC2